MTDTNRPKIVILGGGFAGSAVAQTLARLLPPDEECDIVVVDQNNFLLFTPMLTEVAGGEVDPGSIIAPLRSLSPRVTFEQGRVEKIDAAHRAVTIGIGDEAAGIPRAQLTLSADHLVIALGSVTNFHHIPGVAEHSLTIKSVGEAEAICSRAIALLERADEELDPTVRRELLTFVVGGGGFSGVETMAALNAMVRDLVDRFPNVDEADVRMVIAQPGGRLLPEIGERLAAYAQSELTRRGVEIMLDTLVTGAGPEYVDVKVSSDRDARRIAARTLVWAGGVKPSPAIETAGLELGRHHGIVVDECCRVPGYPGIWALGDCAEVPQPDAPGKHQGGEPKTYAPTAQNASREGAQVARNILAAIQGRQPEPFVYQPIGELALVGRQSGVASLYGMQFSGRLAWAMWRVIYLAKLPRWSKRVRVAVDWLLDAVGGRDIATLPGIGGASGTGRAEQETTDNSQSSM